MKYRNKIGMMIAACGLLAATSCSDYSDYNSEATDSNVMAGRTAYENLTQDERFSDFVALVQKAGYAEELNSPRSYTIWAPANGTFDASIYMAKDSLEVLKEFVRNHIASARHILSGVTSEKVLTLNGKSHLFTNVDGNMFGTAQITTANQPCSNGVLHILDGMEPFYYNIYEFMNYVPTNASKFKTYVKKYDFSYLDERASQPGPIVDGKQTWLDSVMVYSNTYFQNRLRIRAEAEDSSYALLIPTDKAYQEKYDDIKNCFNYTSSIAYQDYSKEKWSNRVVMPRKGSGLSPQSTNKSVYLGTDYITKFTVSDNEYLMDSLASQNTMSNLTFSLTNGRNKYFDPANTESSENVNNDSLFSTSRNYLTNIPELLNAVEGEPQRLSNGWAYYMSSLPFHSWETYKPEIKTRSVALGHNIVNTSNRVTLLTRDISPEVGVFDKNVKEFSYIKGEHTAPTLTTSPFAEIDFRISDVLATEYVIYVVTAPSLLDDEEAKEDETKRKGMPLCFNINYCKADGSIQEDKALNGYSILSGKSTTPTRMVATDPAKIDTICLGPVTFPVCYRGTDAYANLKISQIRVSSTGSETGTAWNQTWSNTYDKTMRISQIILRPKEYDDYLKNKN